MPIFMKAGSIEGDIQAKTHKGWFQVEDCNFEIELDKDKVRARLNNSSQKKMKPIKPELGEFEVTKKTPGRAVPGLMDWMVSGDQLDEVTIDVCGGVTFGDGKWRSHMVYVLKKVLMKDYKLSVSDAEKGELSIKMKLSYETLEMTQHTYDKKNPNKPTVSSSAIIKKPT